MNEILPGGLLATRSDRWPAVAQALKLLAEDRTIANIDRMTGLALARRADSRPVLAAALGVFLSHLRSRGYVCVELDRIVEHPMWRRLIDALGAVDEPSQAAKTGLVGGPGDPTGRPLMAEHGRLYFHRGWQQERELADFLRSRALVDDAPPEKAEQADPMLSGDQQNAVKMALTRGLCVISGGPGTGKTTVAGAIVKAFLGSGGHPQADVGLAAPTGKAATRLAASVNRSFGSGPPHAVFAAQTLHRLLGWNRERAAFRFGPDHRLPLRLLIVDEVSMVDLDLMHSLLSALRKDCRLVLLGDRNQLASVQPGNVLADVCSGFAQTPRTTALDRCIALLGRSYRFNADSGIGALAAAVNGGDPDRVVQVLRSGYADLRWSETRRREFPLPAEFLSAFEQADPASALAAFDRFRILSAHRRGPVGCDAINGRLIAQLRTAGLVSEPYPGGHFDNQLFVVVGNHYPIRLFNGDQGVFKNTGSGLQAFLAQAENGCRRVSPHRLPETQPGFCLTVHRSQGSEFDQVLLILPDESSPLLTRELLYTAITRGRRGVEIWGPEAAIRAAVRRTTERLSGLAERLWGLPDPPPRPVVAAAPGGAPLQGDLFDLASG